MNQIEPNEKIDAKGTTSSHVNAFVVAMWRDYETTLANTNKFIENSEAAYLGHVGEVRKFFESNIHYIENLGRKTVETNKVIVRDSVSKWQPERLELTDAAFENQFESVLQQLEEYAWTPWKKSTEWMNHALSQLEENNQKFIEFLQGRRKSFTSAADEFTASACNYHQAILNVVEK